MKDEWNAERPVLVEPFFLSSDMTLRLVSPFIDTGDGAVNGEIFFLTSFFFCILRVCGFPLLIGPHC